MSVSSASSMPLHYPFNAARRRKGRAKLKMSCGSRRIRRFPFHRASMKNGKAFPIPVRVSYSCKKCPAYCCSYPEIEVTQRDVQRLAKHFGLSFAEADERFTKVDTKENVRLLRHKKDS